MRIFVAIDIDGNMREKLASFQDKLYQEMRIKENIRWVDMAKAHLTMVFVGEVGDDQAEAVCEAVEEVASNHRGGDIHVKGVGCFGRPARVVWAGCDGKERKLERLWEDLCESISGRGVAFDSKRFSPHLTLCRVKTQGAGYKVMRHVEKYESEDFGRFHYNCIMVYKSEISDMGSVYTPIARCKLKGR